MSTSSQLDSMMKYEFVKKLIQMAPEKMVEDMLEVCHTLVTLNADLTAMGLDSCKTVSTPVHQTLKRL